MKLDEFKKLGFGNLLWAAAEVSSMHQRILLVNFSRNLIRICILFVFVVCHISGHKGISS